MKALITGASGGIGKACVKELSAKHECEVLAVSRSEDLLQALKRECEEEFGKEIHVMVGNFSEPGFQNNIVLEVEEKMGGLDLLLNNAGILINKPFLQMNRIDIEEQMRINFEAPFFLIQSLIPLLRRSAAAHVVNIGSMGGFQGSAKFPGLSAYSASKGALATLSECLAAEFTDDKIAFNCLALGSADTEMLRKAFPEYKSPMTADRMAEFIIDFLTGGHKYFNGKVIPVAGLNT